MFYNIWKVKLLTLPIDGNQNRNNLEEYIV